MTAIPTPEKKKRLADEVLAVIETQKPLLTVTDRSRLDMVLALNDPRRTADCVTHIRDEIPKGSREPHYIHADLKPSYIETSHGIADIEIDVLAPEEDTSRYYGRVRPLTMASADRCWWRTCRARRSQAAFRCRHGRFLSAREIARGRLFRQRANDRQGRQQQLDRVPVDVERPTSAVRRRCRRAILASHSPDGSSSRRWTS